jgi:prevent-host-death family protein
MTSLSITKVRDDISEYADQVKHHGQRIIVKRNGKPAFAMVSVEDAELLEALEDEMDIAAAKKALRKGKFASWEQVKKKLRL